MKILIITQFFYPENFRVNELAESLAAQGHRVTVLTGQPNYPKGRVFAGYSQWSRWREKHGKIEIVRVPVITRGSGGAVRLALNYASFILSAILCGVWRVGRADVCFIWSSSPITSALPGLLYARVLKLPVAIWIQDLWPDSFTAVTGVRSAWISRLLSSIVRFVYARCDQIWIQSKAFEPSVRAHGVHDSRIIYLPNWAENLYDRATLVTAPQIAEKKSGSFSIVFAGNLGRAQSLATLLDAADQLGSVDSISWTFVGDGTLREWLVARINEKNLSQRVRWLPSRPASELPELFANADALLVSLEPDPVFESTVPSKVQSYLASGKPILASLNGEGARLIAESGSGLVSNAGDANGLAANVMNLLNSTDAEKKEMGDRAYALYRSQFQAGELLRRAESLLMSLLKE